MSVLAVNPKEVKIYSSPTQRTIFSAAAQISNLFPGRTIKFTPENSLYPSVRNDDIPPFNSKFAIKDDEEIELNVGKNNSLFYPLKCSFENSTDILAKSINYKSLFNFSKTELKNTINEVKEVIPELFDPKTSVECHGKASHYFKTNPYSEKVMSALIKYIIPINYHFNDKKYVFKESTEEFIRKKVLDKWYAPRLNVNSTKLNKISISAFLDVIINNFENLKNNMTNEPKMQLFFGHDTNIVNLLVNLFSKEILMNKVKNSVKNLTDFHFVVPKFASNFLFELHHEKEKGNLYYVRVLYNGELIQEKIDNIEFNNDLGGYPLDIFISEIKKKIDYDYKYLNCVNIHKKAGPFLRPSEIELLKKNENEDEEYNEYSETNNQIKKKDF